MVHVSRVPLANGRNGVGQLAAILRRELTPARRSTRGRSGKRARSTAAWSSSSRLLTPASTWRYLSRWPPFLRRRTLRGDGLVARDDRSAVAQRPEVLGRIEAERGRVRSRTDRNTVLGCQVGLAAVLHDHQVVAFGDAPDAPACRPAVRRDGRARSPSSRDVTAAAHAAGSSVSVSGSTSTIRGSRAARDHCQAGERRRQGGHDDFVAGSDVERAQRQRDRIGAVAHSDRESRAARGRELGLERLDLRTEHEPASLDHACDRRRHVAGRRHRVEGR